MSGRIDRTTGIAATRSRSRRRGPWPTRRPTACPPRSRSARFSRSGRAAKPLGLELPGRLHRRRRRRRRRHRRRCRRPHPRPQRRRQPRPVRRTARPTNGCRRLVPPTIRTVATIRTAIHVVIGRRLRRGPRAAVRAVSCAAPAHLGSRAPIDAPTPRISWRRHPTRARAWPVAPLIASRWAHPPARTTRLRPALTPTSPAWLPGPRLRITRAIASSMSDWPPIELRSSPVMTTSTADRQRTSRARPEPDAVRR